MIRKKITHVTFDMRIGGAERVIYHLVRNTNRDKYDISILCIDEPVGPFGKRLGETGYKITPLKRKPGFDLNLVREIRRHIRENNIDILHCHQYTPYIYGVLGAFRTPARVVFTEHGRFYPDQRKIKRAILNPVLARITDSLTAISAATKEALIRYENFPGNRIQVIYNGIEDLNEKNLNALANSPSAPRGEGRGEGEIREGKTSGLRLQEAGHKNWSLFNFNNTGGIDGKSFILGTVARLDMIKNHPLMIRALKKIIPNAPETRLVIVGDGPEMGNLKNLTSGLGLAEKVIFPGFREDAQDFYEAMDLFLLTSFSEGTAMTLLEAMAAGLPCIVTDVGGNPEIVENGKSGFVIANNDGKALVEKIRLMQGNETLRKEMGKAGRKRFEEKFTVERMVLEYEKVYEKIVNSEQKRAHG